MSTYPNLPGTNVSVSDGNLYVSTANASNNMLIIGKVPAGVSNVPEEPVLVANESELQENFGGYFVGGVLNDLAAEWKAAKDVGGYNVYLLALTGATKKDQYKELHNQLFSYMQDFSASSIVLTGLFADDYIEGLTVEDFDLTEDKIAFPAARGMVTVANVATAIAAPSTATFPLTVTLADNDTLTITPEEGEAVTVTIPAAVYADAEALVVAFNTALGVAVPTAVAEINIDGKVEILLPTAGTIDAAALATALKVNAAQTVFTEHESGMIHAGNPAHLIGNYAEGQSLEINETIAYATVAPPTSFTMKDLQTYVNALTARRNQVSKYVQVVVGPQTGVSVSNSLKTQYVSGAVHYAALVGTLNAQKAPTNQKLEGVTTLRYNFSLRQHNELVGNKYVSFRLKNGRIIVTDGVTTAPDVIVGGEKVSSDFERLSTLRSTNYMISAIRTATEPFIGSPNEFPLYNALNTAIKSAISDAIAAGVIQNASYSIMQGATLGASVIKLRLLPQFELRTIEVSIGLSTPANFN